MPKLSYDNVTMLDNMTRQCHTVMSPRGPVYVASSSCSGSLPFSHERSPDTRCRWVLMIFLRSGPSQLSSCIQCMCRLCGSSWCSHSLDIHSNIMSSALLVAPILVEAFSTSSVRTWRRAVFTKSNISCHKEYPKSKSKVSVSIAMNAFYHTSSQPIKKASLPVRCVVTTTFAL